MRKTILLLACLLLMMSAHRASAVYNHNSRMGAVQPDNRWGNVLADSAGNLYVAIGDTDADYVDVTCSGGTCRLEVEANVTVTSGESIIKDDEGDTVNYRLEPSTDTPYRHQSVSVGESHTFSYDNPQYQVEIHALGGNARFELDSNSADTFSNPITQDSPKLYANGAYDTVTVFVPHNESSAVDIHVGVQN